MTMFDIMSDSITTQEGFFSPMPSQTKNNNNSLSYFWVIIDGIIIIESMRVVD